MSKLYDKMRHLLHTYSQEDMVDMRKRDCYPDDEPETRHAVKMILHGMSYGMKREDFTK